MPVIPSFGSFASTPDTAQAYLGGARLAHDDRQLAASIAQNAAQLSLEREKLSQSAAQAELELAAKQAAQQREELVRQQQMEIEKEYKQSLIGLRQRELDEQQQKLTLTAQAVARQSRARQMYQAEVEAGGDPVKTLFKYGAEMAAPSGFYTGAMRGSGAPTDLGPMKPLLDESGQPTGYGQAASGPASRRILKIPETATTTAQPGPPGYIRWGDKLLPERESIQEKQQKADLKSFLKENEAMMPYITGAKEAPKSFKDRAEALKSEYQRLKATLPTSASTNRIGRFNVISDADVSRPR